jgi:general secretion pathway protein J
VNANRRNGFTLIEVLIAITLLGVIVVLLFASLRIAGKSWNTGEGKIAAVNQKAVVYQFFKRHLTTMRPLPLPKKDDPLGLEATEQAFQGHPQSLQFVAALPAASTRKGLQIFNIQLDPRKSSTIQVSLRPYRETEGEFDSAEPPVVLLEQVAKFNFAYFGKIEEGADLVWHNEWIEADHLPSLIRVSIGLKDGSYWPDMVFAVKITANHGAEITADDQNSDQDQLGNQDQQ